MPTQRQIGAVKLVESYSHVRNRLTDTEKPFFDKVINLMEDISEHEDSKRLLALEAALIAGLMSVRASDIALSTIISGETSLVIKVALIGAVEASDGRRDSN